MSSQRKFRGRLINPPKDMDQWITTDEVSPEHFVAGIERGEIEEASLGEFTG